MSAGGSCFPNPEAMARFKQDHFEKPFIYQQIGSLVEYLVVGQDDAEPVVSGDIELASLGLRLSLEDLHRS